MRRALTFLLLMLTGVITSLTLNGRTKVVTIEYIYQIPENISTEEAKEKAVARAKVQAIADEFGTTVNQINSVLVENANGVSQSDFLSLGGSGVRGEWIEDIEQPVFELLTDGSELAVKVKLKGRIRESNIAKLILDTKILCNGISDHNESDYFNSGDDLYVSFNSPIEGYVAIYLIDNQRKAFCLLPYEAQKDGIFRTKANKKYLFFHPEYSYELRPEEVDQIIVDSDSKKERNRILIIFSPNRFYKAPDVKQYNELPRLMNIEDFQRWISTIVTKDPELTIVERSILISPKNS